jgi:hypothetical protein
MLFTEKEFATFRNFQNRLAKEFGETAYVGADNAIVLIDFSPELKAMLRPQPSNVRFDFSLKQLFCRDCKKGQLYLCLPTQEDCVCDDCFEKRRKKGSQKVVSA